MPELTFQEVLKILRLIDAAPYEDVEVEFEGTKLKVKRRTAARPAPAAAKPDVEKEQTASAPIDLPKGVEVKPPMAGIFYRATSPGAAPFVDIGRDVRAGDQIGIVEVMKLFTPVLSPCDGSVRAILVENEEFVESDRTLMVIEERR